jgi:hypothetical protein
MLEESWESDRGIWESLTGILEIPGIPGISYMIFEVTCPSIDPMPRNDDADFLIGSNPLAIASDDPRAAEYIKDLNAVNDSSNSDCDSDDQE